MSATSELAEFLSQSPSPEEILNYCVSDEQQARARFLLERNSLGVLTEAEERELDEMGHLEHLVILLKARVARRLKNNSISTISPGVFGV